MSKCAGCRIVGFQMGCRARALDWDAFSRHPLARRSSSGANPALGNAESLTPSSAGARGTPMPKHPRPSCSRVGGPGSATSASNPLILLGCDRVSGSRAMGDDR
jgi:hypothetical protein